MVLRLTLLLLGILVSACGGGGGGSESSSNSQDDVNVTSNKPKVSVTGPSMVWSDDYYWSAKATVSGMDLNTVAFAMTGGDEYIDIDSITGTLNSSEENLEIGIHRFIIIATDASGESATTTYTIESKPNIAGIWDTDDTNAGHFEIVSTRDGIINTQYYLYDEFDESVEYENCYGSWNLLDNRLNGEVKCNANLSFLSNSDITYTANIQATLNEDSEIILNKMMISSGEFDGTELVSRDLRFYRWYAQLANVSPGVYIHSGETDGYLELRVNADGSFNALSTQQAIVNYQPIGSCQISGNIVPDPAYDFDFSVGVYAAKLTATGCTSVFNQSNVDAIAAPSDDYSTNTPAIIFGTPGNSEVNDGFNATYSPFFIQVCDEQNQLTNYGISINASCS